MPDDLWEMVGNAFRHHQKPGKVQSPEDALNRILREQITDAPRLDRDSAEAKIETWPMEKIASLRRKHDRKSPYATETPIVVARIGLREALVDGTRRVSTWDNQGDKSDKPVIVVELLKT